MRDIPAEKFPELESIPRLRHSFVLRQPGVPVDLDREPALSNLREGFESAVAGLGFSPNAVATAEQVHGREIAVVDSAPGLDAPLAGVDGLITRVPGILLAVLVADCCAVYIADRQGRAIALVHSGKKGTEGGIAPRAIGLLAELGVPPQDLVVQLSPCIRPPAYEVDFAAQIRSDCRAVGVPGGQVFDAGTCTSRDLTRYYSYRVEHGKTGRMLALLGISPA